MQLNERQKRAILRLDQNPNSNISNVIAIVSGKGGVGKSFVTSILASQMTKRGFQTAILDADITGPSIPTAFGLKTKLFVDEKGTNPATSQNGTKIVSTNLLLDKESSAVVWRSPILTAAIRQFWQDIAWGDVDYMFVDLPPGTSDPQLTIFQSIPLMGIILVTSPQDLVSVIVEKAMDMASKLSIPIIGAIENYSYFYAEDTQKRYEIFGKSKNKEILAKKDIDLLVQIPIKQEFSEKIDNGGVESIDTDFLNPVIDKLLEFEENERKNSN